MENRSTKPPSPPRLPKPPCQLTPLYLNGVKTSQMFSQKRPTTNSLPIAPMTTPSTFTLTPPPRSPKSILLTQQRWKCANPLLKNTLKQDRLYPRNPPKPLLSSSFPRRMEPYIPAKTTLPELPHRLKCLSSPSDPQTHR